MESLTYIYEQLSNFPPTLIKLTVAFVLGGILGLEREAKENLSVSLHALSLQLPAAC